MSHIFLIMRRNRLAIGMVLLTLLELGAASMEPNKPGDGAPTPKSKSVEPQEPTGSKLSPKETPAQDASDLNITTVRLPYKKKAYYRKNPSVSPHRERKPVKFKLNDTVEVHSEKQNKWLPAQIISGQSKKGKKLVWLLGGKFKRNAFQYVDDDKIRPVMKPKPEQDVPPASPKPTLPVDSSSDSDPDQSGKPGLPGLVRNVSAQDPVSPKTTPPAQPSLDDSLPGLTGEDFLAGNFGTTSTAKPPSAGRGSETSPNLDGDADFTKFVAQMVAARTQNGPTSPNPAGTTGLKGTYDWDKSKIGYTIPRKSATKAGSRDTTSKPKPPSQNGSGGPPAHPEGSEDGHRASDAL